MEQMSWFDEKQISEATVKDIDALCEKAFAQREKVEAAKEALDQEKETLQKLETKIIEFLNEVGKSSWKTESGTLSRVERWSVTTPKSLDEKAAFFQYLKDRGMFDEMISVNSRTLQSFYREEQEEAVRSGKVNTETEFSIPGIAAPTMVQTISMRRR